MSLEQTIENLLLAIEMYRKEEEKAINRLSEVLTAYGVEIPEDTMKRADLEEIKEKMEESRTNQEKEKEELINVRRNSRGSADYSCCL